MFDFQKAWESRVIDFRIQSTFYRTLQERGVESLLSSDMTAI